ncbi:MAG: Y-family DNA polymerase [Kangiellaceae bacterium]|jgi:DNA polymerase V|nr:Y-family DNA polymerase [Kangiellaceae bacterium]
MIAIVDCNNFYVSCERIFNPKLENIPVVVLSNNDGCAVARSNEAKKIGIKMRQPFFEIEHLLITHKGVALSSNYALYADMSNRVMKILYDIAPKQEIYSIDECFLSFQGMTKEDTEKRLIEAIKRVKQWTGLPISVGVGKTKTEAKIAVYLAKSYPKRFKSYCNIYDFDESTRDEIYKMIDVSEIWGVGRKLTERMHKLRIQNIYQLKTINKLMLEKNFNVNVKKTVLEINGTSCISIEEIPKKKQIMFSRSFKEHLTTLESVSEAVSTFCERSMEKLRYQHSYCQTATVYIATNRFGPNPYSNSYSIPFQATNDTLVVVKKCLAALKNIFLENQEYSKVGVILSNITSTQIIKTSLFEEIDEERIKKNKRLMKFLDKINYEKTGLIKLASSGTDNKLSSSQIRRSPQYTTQKKDILKIK